MKDDTKELAIAFIICLALMLLWTGFIIGARCTNVEPTSTIETGTDNKQAKCPEELPKFVAVLEYPHNLELIEDMKG